MDFRHIVDEVAERAGLASQGAERALRATLQTLGERMLENDARFLSHELPPAIGSELNVREYPGEFSRDEFFRRVGSRERVSTEFAKEHAIVVCQVLAERLDAASVSMLRSRLPDDLGDLLQPPPGAQPAEPIGRHTQARRGTLATGRPGSEHPLSEAAAERTQSQSVAASENPHGDTKLSSTRGISTERDGRTIATGHTGSDHPIATDD